MCIIIIIPIEIRLGISLYGSKVYLETRLFNESCQSYRSLMSTLLTISFQFVTDK